ncbi:hypothetical protein R80B4_01234 [Fibrobacteres bacterium R8-0-B4]
MITLHEAYIKAKAVAERKGRYLLNSCDDYGVFWGFLFMPPTYDPDNSDSIPNGVSDITVNKETGEIGVFIPPMDLDLFEKRKPIPIDQFADYNVAV